MTSKNKSTRVGEYVCHRLDPLGKVGRVVKEFRWCGQRRLKVEWPNGGVSYDYDHEWECVYAWVSKHPNLKPQFIGDKRISAPFRLGGIAESVAAVEHEMSLIRAEVTAYSTDDDSESVFQMVRNMAEDLKRHKKAVSLLRDASLQYHSGHWDSEGIHEGSCRECLRARELRDKADATLRGEP